MRPPRRRSDPGSASALFLDDRASLMDLVDNILNKGLTLTGDVVLSLANVDLVYLRLSALLCAADKVLPGARMPVTAARAARKR